MLAAERVTSSERQLLQDAQSKAEQTILSLQKQLKQEADNSRGIAKVHLPVFSFVIQAVLCRTSSAEAVYLLAVHASSDEHATACTVFWAFKRFPCATRRPSPQAQARCRPSRSWRLRYCLCSNKVFWSMTGSTCWATISHR